MVQPYGYTHSSTDRTILHMCVYKTAGKRKLAEPGGHACIRLLSAAVCLLELRARIPLNAEMFCVGYLSVV
jgi:hypothetical protein